MGLRKCRAWVFCDKGLGVRDRTRAGTPAEDPRRPRHAGRWAQRGLLLGSLPGPPTPVAGQRRLPECAVWVCGSDRSSRGACCFWGTAGHRRGREAPRGPPPRLLPGSGLLRFPEAEPRADATSRVGSDHVLGTAHGRPGPAAHAAPRQGRRRLPPAPALDVLPRHRRASWKSAQPSPAPSFPPQRVTWSLVQRLGPCSPAPWPVRCPDRVRPAPTLRVPQAPSLSTCHASGRVPGPRVTSVVGMSHAVRARETSVE